MQYVSIFQASILHDRGTNQRPSTLGANALPVKHRGGYCFFQGLIPLK